ncbi:MAG: hypothetical protein M3O80_06695 [Chloroflexota bacterium]|nr:hypothetical protein [Chloroflexota bacterium]
MSNLYSWIVFLHVAALFGFLLAHGASSAVAFRIRRERDPIRIAALLDLSAGVYGLSYASLGLLVGTGLAAAFMGGFWSRGWIWASIVVLIVMTVSMHIHPAATFSRTRKAAGLPYFEGWRPHEKRPPDSADEITAAAATNNPWITLAIGGGGILIILWLMMFKPF